jgi:cytidylate kinase
MHITISGMLGSGKSTICRIFAEKNGYEVYSTGKIQRQVAAEKGLTTLQLNQMMSQNPDLDSLIDTTTVRISEENKDKNIIFDSRMAWYFVKDSYRIFLTVDPLVAAKRVMRSDRGNVEGYSCVEEAKKLLMERASVEHKRFMEIYKADYWDYNNYDLVLDGTWHDPETLAIYIYERIQEHQKTGDGNNGNIIISPKSLYPAIGMEMTGETACENKFAMGKLNSVPVLIAVSDQYNYLLKGHDTVMKALKDNVQFVRAKLIQDAVGMKPVCDPVLMQQYETAGQFEYASKP